MTACSTPQTEPEPNPPAEHVHKYGQVEYVWSENDTICTATKTCTIDQTHIVTESVESTLTEVRKPTYTEKGLQKRVVEFKTEGFESQTKEYEIDTILRPSALTEIDGSLQVSEKTVVIFSSEMQSIDLNEKVAVPSDCTWTLYKDQALDQEISDKNLSAESLENGDNVFYIKSTFTDGYSQVFPLTVHKSYEITVKYYENSLSGTYWFDDKIQSGELYTPEYDFDVNGYVFEGFYDLEGEDYTPRYVFEDDIVIIKTKPFRTKIIFDLDAGSMAGETAYVNYWETPQLDVPERSGCEFLGWMVENSVITNASGGGICVWSYAEEEVIVSAKWNHLTYDIEYNLDGGENDQENPITYKSYDQSIELKQPTKNDDSALKSYKSLQGKIQVEKTTTTYTFAGWYTDAEYTRQVSTLEFTFGDITLYAKWTATEENTTSTVNWLVVNENNQIDPDGEYLLMGEFPNSLKADDVTIIEQNGYNGYCVGSDGCYYKEVTATTFGDATVKAKDERNIVDGQTYYFKIEPIRWKIIVDPILGNGWATMFCDRVIDAMAYSQGSSNVKYLESQIRSFLMGNFKGLCFPTEVQNVMLTTGLLKDDVANTYEKYGTVGTNPNVSGENFYDEIFLLSVNQLTNDISFGFEDKMIAVDTARQKTATDYAIARGCHVEDEGEYAGNCYWWTRSPAYNSNTSMVMCVGPSGAISYEQNNDTNTYYHGAIATTVQGIVPMIRLEISSF